MVDDFVHEMQALIASGPNQRTLFERGAALLERLVSEPNVLPEEFSVPVGRGPRANHGSYALHRSDGLFVSSVVWGPGDHVGAHDHNTWGMIGVIGTGIEETRFRRVDDRDQEGFARLERVKTTLVRPGEVSILTPETDEIHAMNNASDRPTVEIHVYGKDLVGLNRRRYDVESGKVTAFASGKFDNC
jgi:predicted metal-dependent enzyme (double-stranded beta helix superfamily)